MIDLVTIFFRAGDGGHGRVAFRREKYVSKGGPSGGNGGNGGNVILRGVKSKNTLKHLAGVKKIEAQPGQLGGKQKRFGAQGEDVVVEVPIGTLVWLLSENEASRRRRERYSLEYQLSRDEVARSKYFLEKEGQHVPAREVDGMFGVGKLQLFEITTDGQEVVLCQGGFGGRGNNTFKGPANTTPLEAEFGGFGEKKLVTLEQRLLADVGLVGLPNAGKSTLLSVLTKAKPKTADYPFTTLEPNLGIMEVTGAGKTASIDGDLLGGGRGSGLAAGRGSGNELVIADIPGLIEGASQGKGLGVDFLRHIEHCALLMVVLFLPESVVFDDQFSVLAKVEMLWDQYQLLMSELKQYQHGLLDKPRLVVVNKSDLYSTELKKAITEFKKFDGVGGSLQTVDSNRLAGGSQRAVGEGKRAVGGSQRAVKNKQLLLISAVMGEGLSELRQLVLEGFRA